MEEIGVIGAGVMGTGVAQNLAILGFNVLLLDLTKEILDKANETICRNIKLQSFFNKDKKFEEPENIISRINFITDYEYMKDVSFVIENVTENFDIKKYVYQNLESVCQEKCIYLVNTSCISITRIAALTKRPEKVAGTHFMNPVPLIKAVEVIRGFHTSEQTIQSVKDFLLKLGKESIVVNDFPGFVSNRLSHLFMNEAAYLIQDQVANVEEIDNIFKKCYGHKMGPLETADLIGLDTVVNSLEVLYQSYQDSKFKCCPLLRKMVDAGLYGIKSGQGFYKY